MISTRRAARVALVTTLAGALALASTACGDDDTDEADAAGAGESAADAAEASSGGDAEFCEAFVAVDQGLAQLPEDPAEVEAYAADVLEPQVATARASAPDAIAADVGTMADAVDAFVAGGGDFSAMETPEVAEAGGNVYGALGETCGLQQVDVTAVDFGYEGVPDTLDPGQTVFTLANESAAGEQHEMAIIALRDGVDLSLDDLLALPEDQVQQYVGAPPSGVFAPAGGVGGTTVELAPGRYVYACFIPVGTIGDAEGTGQPHFMEGMAGEFVVE